MTEKRNKHICWLLIFYLFYAMLSGVNLPEYEKLTYDIKYGVVSAGSATFNTEKTTFEGQEVWRIYTTAQTNSVFDKVFKVRDTIESIATYDSLFSLKFTKNMSEGTYRQHRIHRNYLAEKYSVYLRMNHKTNTFTDTKIDIPTETFDLLSAMSKIRTMEIQPGMEVPFNVTVDGKSYKAKVYILRREEIKTAIGVKQCLVIEPALEGDAIFKQTGVIHVWITDDEFKIPVLLQSKVIFGHFRAILSKITA
ncbi:MAG: DUF3108 domain-containing protein [Candidatus Cloacimonetes bacterium]|nr:DUF3108 domain-containing protein [Candidatus Cloacimonadota bacterium]